MGFILDVKTKLKTRLDALIDVNRIRAVYDYDAPNDMPTKPAITLSYSDHEAELYTTSENLRDLQFLVRVYVSASSNKTAEEDLISVVEDVIQDLESDPTLDGDVINVICNSASVDTENSTEDIRIANLNIVVQIIKAR